MLGKRKLFSKSNLATISAIFYGALCAIIFFSVWVFEDYLLSKKIFITVIIAICAVLSSLATLAKLHGIFTRSIETSFAFGASIILFASVIIYLLYIKEVILAFYAFLSIALASLGTYFLIYSAKLER